MCAGHPESVQWIPLLRQNSIQVITPVLAPATPTVDGICERKTEFSGSMHENLVVARFS
jgi:hypothetical protein